MVDLSDFNLFFAALIKVRV